MAGRLARGLDEVAVKAGAISSVAYFESPTQLNVLAMFAVPPPRTVSVPVSSRLAPSKTGVLPAPPFTPMAFLAPRPGPPPRASGDRVTLFGTGVGPTVAAWAIGNGGLEGYSLTTAPLTIPSRYFPAMARLSTLHPTAMEGLEITISTLQCGKGWRIPHR